MSEEILSAIEEWQKSASKIQQTNGPLSKLQRQRLSELLSRALATADEQLATRLFLGLGSIPSGIAGRAFGHSVAQLSIGTRAAFRKWLVGLPQDKQEAECLYALPGVLRGDPHEAFDLLLGIRPHIKDSRARVASALMSLASADMALLFDVDREPYKIRKVALLMLGAAEEQQSTTLRAAVLLTLGPIISAHKLYKGSENCRKRVLELIESLPEVDAHAVRQVMPEELAGLSAEAGQRVFEDSRMLPLEGQADAKQDTLASVRSGEPQSTPPADQKRELACVNTASALPAVASTSPRWLGHAIGLLQEAQETCAKADQEARLARSLYQAEANVRQELELEISRLQAELLELKASKALADQLQTALDALESQLSSERQRSCSFESYIAALKERVKATEEGSLAAASRFEHERDALTKRIDDHAAKCMADLKAAIANSIRPLVAGRPSLESHDLAACAPNLLVMLEQTLDALREKGVAVEHGGER